MVILGTHFVNRCLKKNFAPVKTGLFLVLMETSNNKYFHFWMIQTSPFSHSSWKKNIWGLLWQKFTEWVCALIFTDIALLCSIGSECSVSKNGNKHYLGLCFTSTFYLQTTVSLFFPPRHLWAQPYTRKPPWASCPIPHGCLWKLGIRAVTAILWTKVVKGAFQGQKRSEGWVMIPLWEVLIPVALPKTLVFADFALIFSGTAHCCFSDYLTLFSGAQVG